MEGKAQVRLELTGDLLRKFNAIKKDLGLESNSEVIRLLISKYPKELRLGGIEVG